MVALVRMTHNAEDREEVVRQHSGWLIPIVVFVVTAGLSALFLLYYLAPSPASFIEEHPTLTARTDPVLFEVGRLRFAIPANYVVYRNARQGGPRKDVSLITMLPDFRGYASAEAQAFNDHSSDSPVVHILIREEHLNLPERERFKRIYLGYVADPKGRPGPFGLTEYAFRDDSGYAGEDLFVGHRGDKLVVMRCWRFSQEVPSPNCLRDRRLGRTVAVTYRFKRANLAQWRAIGAGVDGLMASFEARAR